MDSTATDALLGSPGELTPIERSTLLDDEWGRFFAAEGVFSIRHIRRQAWYTP